MPKITKRSVDAIKADGRDRIVWDDSLPGFGVRVRKGGAMSYVYQYRPAGMGRSANPRKLTIGAVGTLTPDQARKIAEGHALRAKEGGDPAQEKRDSREAPTVADLIAYYQRHHLLTKRPSSQAEDEGMIERIIEPNLGRRKVAEPGLHDCIKALHRSLADKPYRANRLLSLLSKMFAIASGPALRWRDDNPVKGIARFPEDSRERYLTREELKALITAVAAYPDRNIGNAIVFIILTGCRKGEALAATWGQFDLDRGTWTKPSSHTKQKRSHRVPLNRPALELLASIGPVQADAYVFPSSRRPGQPLTTIKSAWRAITREAGIEGLRVHDLRHSYASFLVSSGHSLPTIGRLLGHSSTRTTERYAHLTDDALKNAVDKAGDIIAGSGGL